MEPNTISANSPLLRTSVVLHRPIYPRNIGMCARAMGNLGCTELHIISPRCDWTSSMVQHEARQGSTHSSEILVGAKVHASINEYLENHGQGIKFAFSARDGVKKNVTDFSDRISTLSSQSGHPFWNSKSQIQLHFGSEDDGLTLEELEPANFICRLPARGHHTSFNLSHAVLIALYILESEAGAFLETSPSDAPHSAAKETTTLPPGRLEYPKKAIRDWLEALGFDLGSRKVTIETSLNRVLLSNCPLPEDVRLLEKVLFQTVEKLQEARKRH